MKRVYKAALVFVIIGVALFLFLSYKTMYQQNNSIPILEYHNLTVDPGKVDSWTLSAKDFDNQISYLKENCHVVPLKSLLGNIDNGIPVPDHTVAITFDDGYQSNYTLAYPILEKYQTPATFFIVGKYVQNNGGGYQSMTWDELKLMNSSGLIDIESHSYDLHHRVPGSPKSDWAPAALTHIMINGKAEDQKQYDQRIQSDLTQARQDIKAQLGYDSDILCWPYGANDKHSTTLARQAGFKYMIGGTGYIHPSANIEDVHRMPVMGGMNLQEFEKTVNPDKVNFFQAMGLELKRIELRLPRCIWKSNHPDHLSGLVPFRFYLT
jgi:Predicted xylanase/chitin deacetylase